MTMLSQPSRVVRFCVKVPACPGSQVVAKSSVLSLCEKAMVVNTVLSQPFWLLRFWIKTPTLAGLQLEPGTTAELILADNGSTDDTPAVLAQATPALQKAGIAVRTVSTGSDDEFYGQVELAFGSAGPAALRPLDVLTPRVSDVRE